MQLTLYTVKDPIQRHSKGHRLSAMASYRCTSIPSVISVGINDLLHLVGLIFSCRILLFDLMLTWNFRCTGHAYMYFSALYCCSTQFLSAFQAHVCFIDITLETQTSILCLWELRNVCDPEFFVHNVPLHFLNSPSVSTDKSTLLFSSLLLP